MNIFCHSGEDEPVPYLIRKNPDCKNKISVQPSLFDLAADKYREFKKVESKRLAPT